MTPAEVLKFAEKNGAKMVDFKFVDLLGIWQHTTMPIHKLEAGTFKSWPDAPVTFPKADGVYWHNWVPPVLILHYTAAKQDWKDAEIVVAYSKK